MNARKPPIPETFKNKVNFYSYADSINKVMNSGKIYKKRQYPNGITTMMNTVGRDDKMYFITEGYNLKKDEEEESATTLAFSNK